MKRTASAVWQGTLKEGKGTVSSQSGVLKDTPYSFQSRFGDAVATNPEELIAAAHAGCFTMAMSNALGQAGFTAERLATAASLTFEQVDGKWTITTIHLELKAKVPGIDKTKFQEAADGAKANCPISRALTAKITLAATLEG
jgi:osmotically inducible protein OsmC